MGKTGWTISETAKRTGVDAHVLRFWEEELSLAVGRNQKGHRIYTEENLQQLEQIQELKKKGYQLKDIRDILHGKAVSDISQPDQEPTETEAASAAEKPDRPAGSASIAMARMEKRAGLTAVAMARADQATDRGNRVEQRPERGLYGSEPADDGVDRHEEFYSILEKLVREITVNNHREGRYKRLDAAIRRRQESRKMVAVTEERQRTRKKYVK